MACRTIAVGPGMFAIACDRGQRRQNCGTPGCGGACVALCDFPVTRKGKAGTCSAKMCATCRWPQGEGKDYCPPHHRSHGRRHGDPVLGERRIHIATGRELYVLSVHDFKGERLVTFSTAPPDACGVRQTVLLAKWIEKTREP